ncbi:MAG TPA: hypothetical protein VFM14_18145 [Gemmatimonadales bacterium]|nr:hypothetical protein [Gemmatimonadales bacterium]
MASSRGRTVVGALLPVALLLIASPLADLTAALLPLRFAEVSWRFGAYGLLTNALVTPILGLAIILVLYGFRGQRRPIAVAAGVAALVALVLIGGFALFVLDYLQLRQAVGRLARGPYDSAAFKAMIVATLEAIVLLSLAVTGFRASGIADAARGRRRRERVGLVVQVEDEGHRP